MSEMPEKCQNVSPKATLFLANKIAQCIEFIHSTQNAKERRSRVGGVLREEL